MKRDEVKQLFETEFNNIIVSDDLVEKTLQKLQNNKKSAPSLYWLRNCAAVLVVSCICLGVYLINNSPYNYNSAAPKDSKNTLTAPTVSNEHLPAPAEPAIIGISTAPKMRSPSAKSIAPVEEFLPDEIYPENEFLMDMSLQGAPATFMMNSCNIQSFNSEELTIGDTADKLLSLFPDAVKTEDGYTVFANEVTTRYIIQDNLITDIQNN